MPVPCPTTAIVPLLHVHARHCSQTCLHHGLEFTLTICNICSTHIILHLNSAFCCSEFRWMIISVVQQISVLVPSVLLSSKLVSSNIKVVFSSQITSCFCRLLYHSFEAVLRVSVADFFVLSREYYYTYCLGFTHVFCKG